MMGRNHTGYRDAYDDYDDRFEQPYDDGYGPVPAGETGPVGRHHAQPAPSNVWKYVLAGLAVVLVFVVVTLLATSLLSNKKNNTASSKQITIPRGLVGQPVEVVENRLRTLGFTDITRKSEESTDKAKDSVLRINPPEGTAAAKDAPITLTVATSPGQVTIPGDIVGMTQAAAQAELQGLGLQAAVTQWTGPASHGVGKVESTNPAANTTVAKGTMVTLNVVSPTVSVPNEVGRPVDAALNDLQGYGLTARQQPVSSSQPTGTVVDQSPKNTSANRGSTVTLYIAQQAPPTTQPPTQTETPSATPTEPETTPPSPLISIAPPTIGGGGGRSGGR
jgi:serine/threonine-protein kinase